MIRKIEGLCPKLNGGFFRNRKRPRQGHIELKNSGTFYIEKTQVAVGAGSGRRKGIGRDPLYTGCRRTSGIADIGVHSGNKVRGFGRLPRQSPVDACRHRKKLSGSDRYDGRDLPIAGGKPQRPVGEFRRLGDRGKIEDLPLVSRLAVPPECPSIAGEAEGATGTDTVIVNIA